jgi:hypothetical protein
MRWLRGRRWRSAKKAGGDTTPSAEATSETSASETPTGTPTGADLISAPQHRLPWHNVSTGLTSRTSTAAQVGDVHLEHLPGQPARWVSNADVVDPADEYEDTDVPTPTQKEKHVSYKLSTTISDEAKSALDAAAKDGETVNDTVRRILHKSLKLPRPGK